MNGNFTYHNPTRLHFGENAMEFLKDELTAFGPTVMLSYGGGSIKRNGIYDQVVAALESDGKSDDQVADEGLAALEGWMREIGVSMNITELGATEAMIPELVKATFRLNGGYKQLTEEEVAEIFRQSL